MFHFAKGIGVNVSKRATLLEDIRTKFKAGDGFSVATLNLDHVVKLRQDDVFLSAYGEHEFITADGNPIVKFAHLAGQEVELVPGSELIEPIVEIACDLQVKIALFGSTEESLQHTADVLRAKYPGLDVALTHAPPMGFDPTGAAAEAFLDQLRTSGAGVCFIALGAPKQEVFAAFAQKTLKDVGFLSIGAGLDFISGRQHRAPKIIRQFALEWLWRWAKSPRRLTKRYVQCIAILPVLLGETLKVRRSA